MTVLIPEEMRGKTEKQEDVNKSRGMVLIKLKAQSLLVPHCLLPVQKSN